MEPDTPDSMQIGPTQKFTLEMYSRAINQCDDVDKLRSIAKTLLEAWMSQKAAAEWAYRQSFLRRNSLGRYPYGPDSDAESQHSPT